MKNKIELGMDMLKTGVSKYGADICSIVGFGSGLLATIQAVKATPKALALIEDAKKEKEYVDTEGVTISPDITRKEIVKVAWRPYVSTMVLTGMSAGFLVASRYVSIRQITALGVAYKLTENEFSDYKDKVKEIVGVKKTDEVKESLIKDRVENTPMDDHIVTLGDGNSSNTLFFDYYSGRFFRADVETVRKALNDFNYDRLDVFNGSFVTLNEFYYYLGLDGIGLGDNVGWSEEGPIDLEFSGDIAKNNEPCVAIHFSKEPSINPDVLWESTLPF